MAVLSRSIGDDIVEIYAPQVDITRRVWIKYTFYFSTDDLGTKLLTGGKKKTEGIPLLFYVYLYFGLWQFCLFLFSSRSACHNESSHRIDLLSGSLACCYHCSIRMWSNFTAGSTAHANGELLKFTTVAVTTYLLMCNSFKI